MSSTNPPNRKAIPPRTILFAAALATLLSFAAPLHSQPEEPAPPEQVSPQEELRRLNATLREIADLLRQHLERQETDVFLRRLDLSYQRLAPLENELRSARSEKEGVAAEMENMAHMLAAAEEQIEQESSVLEGDDGSQRMKREIEARVEQLKRREWQLEQQIVELENRLARRLEDVQALEEWIDERLGLR
jgi:chromosome segregation ATPase